MTPQHASSTVQAVLPGGWKVSQIYENSDYYMVGYGRIDGKRLINVPLVLVNKRTGELGYLPYLGNEDLVDSMSEVE